MLIFTSNLVKLANSGAPRGYVSLLPCHLTVLSTTTSLHIALQSFSYQDSRCGFPVDDIRGVKCHPGG